MMAKKITISALILMLFNFSMAKNRCEFLFSHSNELLKKVAMQIQSGDLKPQNQNFFARILRGKSSVDFRKLSADKGRHVVMLMDSSGVDSLYSKQDQLSPLERIGYTKEYISELTTNGTKFKIALVSEQQGIKIATWENLGSYLESVYKENPVVFGLYKKYLAKLKATDFESLQAEWGQILTNINSEALNSNSSIWEFRSFLYNELRLTELYTGNGYTKTPSGERGLKEYFILNQNLDDSFRGNFKVLDLI